MRLIQTVAFWSIATLAWTLGGCGFFAPAGALPQGAGGAGAGGSEKNIVIEHLPNGVTVLVKPSRTVPVVTVRGYVRTGSLYEGKYLGCGISHLTEHLVAQGAEHLMDGQPSAAAKESNVPDRVRQIGGQSNASTSLDHTVYFISAESSKVMDCIDLITDWLLRPQIGQADFDREHGIVQRELEMGKDDPERQLWYASNANLFDGHPAAVPVIGYAEPLKRLTFADFQDYHARTYVPQNMVLVIIGDVDVQAVLQHVRQAVADVPRGRAVEHALPAVPPVVAARRRTIEMPTLKETLQQTSFQTIPLVHEDLYALDLLSDILSARPTSRLPERILRQQKLVTAISSESWTPAWGRGALEIEFRCAPDKADAAEAAVLTELAAVKQMPVSDEELARAKRQKVTEWVLSQQSVESQAETVGDDYLSTEDPAFSAAYTQRIQTVTAEQVRDVARKYLDPNRMVVTRLTPLAKAAATTARASVLAPTEERQGPAAEVFTLPNGLRVVLLPLPAPGGRGLVSMAFVTEGGLLLEDGDTNGLGALMMALSIKGADNLSADDIAGAFHSIIANCGNNSFYWLGTVLDEEFPRALEVFSRVIQHPTFSDKELEILRPAQLAAIERLEEDWQPQLSKFFRSRFFVNSPYSMPEAGSKSVVAAATRDQIVEHYRKSLRAAGSVLVICGHFDPAAARPAVEKLFADLPPGRVFLRLPPQRRVVGGQEQYVLKTDQEVAGIVIAAPGMKVGDVDDRLAMDVLETILSGYHYPSGWLFQDLRGRRLVYVVYAYNWVGLAPGAFITAAACQPESVGLVVGIIKRDLAKTQTYVPTQEEVNQAVNTILTAEQLENQTAASLALSSALDELYGLGYDWRWRMAARYHAVKPQDVRDVAQKYFSKGLVTVVTSPLGEASLKLPTTQPAAPPAAGAAEPPSHQPPAASAPFVRPPRRPALQPISQPASQPATTGPMP
jgi:zinc protease